MNMDFIKLVLTVYSLIYGDVVYSGSTTWTEKKSFVCSFTSDTLTVRYGYKNEIVNCLKVYKSAKRLELTDSGLQCIPSYIGILKNLSDLNLSNNDLKTANFRKIFKVCSRLSVVILDHNDIRKLKRDDLDCLASVKKLSIANNSLTLIENGTFNENLKKIDYIGLIHNNLTTLDTSLLSKVKISPNVSIRINASWNSISIMTNSINLTIEDISKETEITITGLHNNLTTIDVNYYLTLLNVTNYIQLLNFWNCGFDVRFNPWICDCAMLPAAKLLAKYRFMDPDSPLFSITCNTPQPLNGKLIREVPDDQFNCSVNKRCPQLCSCEETVALNLITVECGSNYIDFDLPAEVPRFTRIRLLIRRSHLKTVSYRHYLSNTTEFDVSGSDVTDVQTAALKALDGATLLKFEGNNFEYLPLGFKNLNFSNGKILTLQRNPFRCDCHSLWMKYWIIENKQSIKMYNKIICFKGPGAGHPVIEVPDDQFVCSRRFSFSISRIVIPGVTLLVTTIILTAFALRKDGINTFVVTRFSVFSKCFEKNCGYSKYKIFMPHSCENDNPVYQIGENLEKDDPTFTVFVGKNFSVL